MDSAPTLEKAAGQRWDEKKAWSWYEAQPWLVGCNYTPRHAVNQLEMWQAETFHPHQIDEELGWLAAIGMNTLRVFLHDLLWQQAPKDFLARVGQFLDIAEKHKIGLMFVLFDSCWNPYPQPGIQREPTPRVHNSYWAQSPGATLMNDPAAFDRLEGYVTGVVDHFRNDPRVLIWDVWNEPDNLNMGAFQPENITGKQKAEIVFPLLAKTFQWVRSANPTQPLTSGIWAGDWSSDEKLTPLQKLQLHASDIPSFHQYTTLEETRKAVAPLKRLGRPLICTEYLARGVGNTFQAILPYFKDEKIAAYNWGAVAGKTQTQYPWDSWQKVYTDEPVPWHHDVFRPDGSPYDPAEIALIKSLINR